MDSMKAVVEEVKCFSGYSHVAPNPENNFCGGCCEGTVFTFTSTASNGKFRQRLRYRATALNPHAHREEPIDSVFSELRIMPPSRETSCADGEVPNSTRLIKSTLSEGGCKSIGADIPSQARQEQVLNLISQKDSERHVGTEDGERFCSLTVEESVTSLKKPEILDDEVTGVRYLRGENYSDLQQNGKAINEQGWRSGEEDSPHANLDSLDSKGCQDYTEPLNSDRKDDKSHKRSCGEQVQVFQQRKLRCARRRPEELFATSRIESVRNDLACKVGKVQTKQTELRMVGLSERGGRLEIEAELKNLQARQHVTGLKRNMRKNGQSKLTEPAHDVVKDLGNGVCNQTTVEKVDRMEDHGKENGHCGTALSASTPRMPGHVFPSNGPLACSFISFKGGISSLQGRTFSFGGQTFTRAEGSTQKSEGITSAMTKVSSTKRVCDESVAAKSLGEEHLVQEISAAESGLAFGRISAITAADAQITMGETFQETASSGWEANVPLKIDGNGSVSFIRQDATRIGTLERILVRETLKSRASDQLSGDLAIPYWTAKESSQESKGNGRPCRGQEDDWPAVLKKATGGGRFGRESANANERRSHPPLQRKKPSMMTNDGVTSRLLDWYGSPKHENGIENCCMEDDTQYFQTHKDDENCSTRSVACSEDAHNFEDGDNPLSFVETFDPWKENREVDVQQILDERKVNSGSGLKVGLSVFPGTGGFEGDNSWKGMISTERAETEYQEEACVHNEAWPMKSQRKQQASRRYWGCSRYDLPVHRHAWNRSFKKKRIERVNYFEKWWGRGTKKSSLNKRFPKFGSIKNGLNRVYKPRRSSSLDLQAEDIPAILPYFQLGEGHVPSPTWLKMKSEADFDTKEHGPLQAVLKSEFCLRENDSVCSDSVRGECNILPVFVSSPTTQQESSNNECPLPRLDLNQGLGGGEVSSSEKLDWNEAPHFTEASGEETYGGSDEENTVGTKAAPGTFEREYSPSSSSSSGSQGREKSTSKRFSAALSSGVKDGSAESKLITVADEENKSFEAKEPCDCVAICSRSSRYCYEESVRQYGEQLFPITQALTVSGRCGYLFERAVSDCTVPGNYFEYNAAVVKETSVCGTSMEEIAKCPSFHLNFTREEAYEQNLATELLGIPQHSVSCRAESPQSSGISKLEKKVANMRLDLGCADSAMSCPTKQEDFKAPEEPSVNEISKPVISRKHKTPIGVRVKNGLANGWLLQSFIWKRFGKQKKSKSVELPSPSSEDVSLIQIVEPLCPASAGQAGTCSDGTLVATQNSSLKEGKEECEESIYESTCRGEKTSQVSQKVVLATSKTSLGRNFMSELVRDVPTGSQDPPVTTICYGSKDYVDTSLSTKVMSNYPRHISASECSPDHDEKAGQNLAFLPANNSELTTSDAVVDGPSLCHNGLQQLAVHCEVQDKQESECLETFREVAKDYALREHNKSLSKPSKVPVANEGENLSPPNVEPAAVCVHGERKLAEVSPKVGEYPQCKNGVKAAKPSNEAASPHCSEFAWAHCISRRSKEVPEYFPGQEEHQDIEAHLSKCKDHSFGWDRGRPKRNGLVLKSRIELVLACRKRSPDSAVSAKAHGEDNPPSPNKLDTSPSSVAATLSPSSGIGSRDKDNYKRLSRLLPPTGATKDIPTVLHEASSLKQCKNIPPDGSSSYLTNSTHCKDRLLRPGEMRNINPPLLRQENNVKRSKTSCGSGGISQLSHAQNISSRAAESEVKTYTPSHETSPRLSPMNTRNESRMAEILKASEEYDDDHVRGHTQGRDEAAPFEAKLVLDSARHVEAKGIDRGMVETAADSEDRQPPWILEKGVDGWGIEEGATARTESALSEQNGSGNNIPGTSPPSTIYCSQPYKSEHSNVRAIQETDRLGSWLPQDQDSLWPGPPGEKGNADSERGKVASNLPAEEAFWLPRSLESNGPDTRETQTSALCLDELGMCPSRSQEQFMDPNPWNKPRRSSTAPTFYIPMNRIRADSFEVGQPRQASNSPSCSDSQAHRNVVRKDEPQHRLLTDGHTQDQVFLERFSTGNDSQNSRMQHRRNSSLDFCPPASGSSWAPILSGAACVSNQSRYFPSQDELLPARQDSFTRKVEPGVPKMFDSLFASLSVEPAAPQQNPTIHPFFPNVEPIKQPLPYYVERAKPISNMVPTQAYHTYETGFLPDFRNSFSSVSPCSSMNGYPESISEKSSLKPKLCLHGSTGYDPGVPWGHYSDEGLDFKAFPSQSCISSMPLHNPPSVVHSPNLTLNSKTFRPSCHTAQSAPPSCDPCNYNSLCSNSSCSNQCPVCGPMLHQPQCHSSSEHILGHQNPAYISAHPTETAVTQHMRVPVSHGCVGQYAPKATMGRYTPPQTATTHQTSWPVREKNVASNMCGDTGIQDCDSAHKKQQDSGLVWLTGEEMNLIRELRLSVGKDRTRSLESLPDPEPSPMMSYSSTATGLREGSFCAGGSNISHASSISRCSNYSTCTSPRQIPEAGITHTVKRSSMHSKKLACLPSKQGKGNGFRRWSYTLRPSQETANLARPNAVTLHIVPPHAKELTRDSLLKRWITSMQNAASIIQRAWRALMRRRREKAPSRKALPKKMEDFYELIKTRPSSKNFRVPSFDDFVRSVKYIQARTEGARVRRRLKSRRLQAIIMEIKEIRNLLYEMSKEANRDASAPYLYPQLCNQLQQKILQLHTALTGPQMQARFLLRRGPATPLVLYPSKSPAVSASSTVATHKGGNQHYPKMLTSFPQSKTSHSQPPILRRQGSRGKVRQSAVRSEVSVTEPPESAKLLPWYFLAQRSPSKPINGRRSPTDFTSTFHESHMKKKDSEEMVMDSSSSQIVNKGMLPYQQVSLKTDAVKSNINEIYEEQPLTLMQRRKTNDLSFDEIPIGTANAGMFTVDFGSSVELSDKPKRPFLKRKSIMMAPQKLDWSKVKPMVSSRLEPELKTKLSYCRHTKAVDRPAVTSTSRRKKENYSQVKSRLFSYEENVSPGSSGGNVYKARYNESDEAEISPRSRGGSYVEGMSESGENNRLVDYPRPASPDLLRLKSQVQAHTESELAFRRAQASIQDAQIQPTYSSRFDSARYLHKLGNSEQAAKDSSMQSTQPRTQRIRLRLIPGSEENEPGKVLVQKIENQEEEIRDLWHDQRIAMKNRRRQSHSHRYASYRESSQGDAQQTSKLDDFRRPTSPPDRRSLKAFASSKMGLATKELEEMFERVIAAKCGRNITLSDLFERDLFEQTQR